jgi:hypothetical protein
MEKHTKDKRKMKNLKNVAVKTMETKVRSIKSWRLLFALVLAAAILAPHPAYASGPCTVPQTGGAWNMTHDATMLTIPMTHDAAQGNAGMTTAVVNSCS